MHNTKLWHLVGIPIRFGIGLADTITGLMVFAKTLPIVNDATSVEFVVKDAVSALPIAIDGRGIPIPTTW